MLIAAFFRHSLCRILVEKVTARATGLKISIEKMSLDILNNNLYMRGITLSNPPGFKDEILGKAENIFIVYDLWGSLKGRLHLRLLKININELNIIRNTKGASNVSTLKNSSSSIKLSEKSGKSGGLKNPKKPKFLIDRLELSIEKATFMDYKAEVGQPAAIILTVKGPCIFKNVSDLGYVFDSVSARGGFKELLDNLSGVAIDEKRCQRKKKAQES